MKVRRRTVDSSAERLIITGMIISDRVLREIAIIYDPGYIRSSYARKVADWCLNYFQQHDEAPRGHIQDIYLEHVKQGIDEDESELIASFLADLSTELERSDKFNEGYIIQVARKRFKGKSLENLADQIRDELDRGNVDEAEHLLSDYKPIGTSLSKGINPFIDEEAIFNAFEQTTKPLLTFPGAFGSLVNDHLVREGLIGIMAPEKRGKTFLCFEIACRAALARNNVAVFQAGDMSELQGTKRFHIWLSGRSDLEKYCGDLTMPVPDCRLNQSNSCNLSCRTCGCGLNLDEDEELGPEILEKAPPLYRPCSECIKGNRGPFRGSVFYEKQSVWPPLTWKAGLKAGKQFMKRLRSRDFKMASYPNDTLTVRGITSQLDMWEHFEGFIPDVIIIDYADILAAEDPRKEFRHQQNDTWKALRRLSQEKNCLVVVPTQADAKALTAAVLREKHFSEDKRKYSHVTGMLGLMRTDAEKHRGLARVNWLVLREGEFYVDNQVTLLQSLQRGRPFLGSF